MPTETPPITVDSLCSRGGGRENNRLQKNRNAFDRSAVTVCILRLEHRCQRVRFVDVVSRQFGWRAVWRRSARRHRCESRPQRGEPVVERRCRVLLLVRRALHCRFEMRRIPRHNVRPLRRARRHVAHAERQLVRQRRDASRLRIHSLQHCVRHVVRQAFPQLVLLVGIHAKPIIETQLYHAIDELLPLGAVNTALGHEVLDRTVPAKQLDLMRVDKEKLTHAWRTFATFLIRRTATQRCPVVHITHHTTNNCQCMKLFENGCATQDACK
jgi:hypothetical protein